MRTIKNAKLTILLFILIFHGTVFAGPGPDFNWYWAFYETEKGERMDSYVVRPFFMENKYQDSTFQASFMPIAYWSYETEEQSEWKSIFGFINSLDYTHNNGVKDYDFGFIPFFLFGQSKETKDRYLHIWPFGGTIKGKLGQDRITTYTFPGFLLLFLYPPTSFPLTWTMTAVVIASLFPAYVDYESRDYKAKGILWPFVQWGKSPKRDDFRFLPFYAHNYKEGFYDNYSYGMLVNIGKVFLRDDEQKTVFVLPFYGKRWNVSDKIHASSLFWPFFSYGFDSKRGSFELTFLWPLIQVQDSVNPRLKKRIFFPLYGDYEYDGKKLSFYGPFLYTNLSKKSKNFDSDYTIAMIIFFWYFKRDYKKEPSPEYGSSWRYFKFWPLFHCEWDDRGNFSFNLISPLPFRDPDGYEKLYQPFWTLYEYKKLHTGEKRLGFLMRLYYQRWGDDFLYIKVPVILSFSKAPHEIYKLSITDYLSLFCYKNNEDGKYYSLLFSMFCYNNDSDGEYIRLFWIPIDIGNESNQKKSAISKTGKSDRDIQEKGPGGLQPEGIDWYFVHANNVIAKNEAVLFKMRVF